jgi:hypothetical protein
MRPFFETVRHTLDGHIMTPAVGDAKAVDRHFRFLVRQLVLGIVGLSAFPIWLALGAPGSLFTSLTFVWLLAPLLIAASVLRTGRLETGQHLATFALAGLILWVSAMTGGLSSPLVLLFAVVPLAARADGPLPSLTLPLIAAGIGLACCALFDLTGLAAKTDSPYAGIGLLVAILAVAGAGFWLRRSQERPSGPEVETGEVQAFTQAVSSYNPQQSSGEEPDFVDIRGWHSAGESALGRGESEGRVVALGLRPAAPASVGGERRIQERTAREVRNSA